MIVEGVNLSDVHIKEFDKEGYLVYPSFLTKNQITELIKELDANMNLRESGQYSKLDLFQRIGWLTSLPALVKMISILMSDSKFALHHLHGVKQEAGEQGVGWHHDYEQIPVSNHSHKMFHCFFYINGLNGSIGDLQVLPGSHLGICDYSMPRCFGSNELPNSKTFNELPEGSLVIVQSALWHRRRASVKCIENYSRYFVDASFCEYGIKWPRDRRFDGYDQIAKERGFSQEANCDFLFNKDLFFHYEEAKDFEKNHMGSYLNWP